MRTFADRCAAALRKKGIGIESVTQADYDEDFGDIVPGVITLESDLSVEVDPDWGYLIYVLWTPPLPPHDLKGILGSFVKLSDLVCAIETARKRFSRDQPEKSASKLGAAHPHISS